MFFVFMGFSLFSSMCLNKGIVFFLVGRNESFFLIVLVVKHLLENKVLVLDFFLGGRPCSQAYA